MRLITFIGQKIAQKKLSFLYIAELKRLLCFVSLDSNIGKDMIQTVDMIQQVKKI